MPTSNLLCLDGRQIVIDCGLGVTRGLVDQGMELKNLSLIFITHLHSDHYLELGPLIHTAWTAGLNTKVQIFGPKGIDAYWQHFLESMTADIALRIEDEGRPDLAKLVELHLCEEGDIFSDNGLNVSAIRTEHPPLTDCFALCFASATRKVVFSGDTAPLDDMARFAQGADLLVHEAMLESALPALVARVGNGDEKLMAHLKRSHTPADKAAQIATEAQVKALALSHLIPADDPSFTDEDWLEAVRPHWKGPLFIGHDDLKIDLTD
jgi:ribonuclease BN (tRNA processing enzyme)